MRSGGGNHVAGNADVLRILADNCAKAQSVQECHRVGQPNEIAGAIAAYSQVTGKLRTYDATAPVSVHHHDYAWPTGTQPGA